MLKPRNRVFEAFVAPRYQWLHESPQFVVNWLARPSCLRFLVSSNGISAYVAKLQYQASMRLDEKALLNNLCKAQRALFTAQQPYGLVDIPRHLMVLIRNKNSKGLLGQRRQVAVDDLGHQRKRRDVGIY